MSNKLTTIIQLSTVMMALKTVLNIGNGLIFLSISVFFTFVYIKFIRKNKRIKKYLDEYPGPPTLPILGNALAFAVPNEGM